MRLVTLPAVLAAAALIVGCGSSNSSSSGSTGSQSQSTSTSSSTSTSTGAVPLAAATVGSLHRTVLTGAGGRTLYVLTPETSTHLLCTSSACVQAWPPVTVSSASALPHAVAGVSGTLGTVTRPDGTVQVTIDGQPLYTYAGDSGSGQANGEGLQSFGGTWYVVSPAGAAVHSGGEASAGGASY